MKPSLTIYALHDAFDASELDLRGAIAFAREIGMAGMELGYYWQEEHRECELAKQWLADAGLAASGYIISTNFVAGDETEHKKQIATVKRGIDRARQLGAPFVRVFAGSRPGRSFAEDRDVVVEALRECLAYAEAIDVKIAMENHGGIGANSEQLRWSQATAVDLEQGTNILRLETKTSASGNWDLVLFVFGGIYLVAFVCWLFVNTNVTIQSNRRS